MILPYRIGERVVCINARGNPSLVQGQIYTIIARGTQKNAEYPQYDETLKLALHGINPDVWLRATRFQPLESKSSTE